MKLEDLPEFAKPYKTKGYDVRLHKGSYILLKISSHREEGKKYPVLSQEYIGVILPDGSLKRKAEEKPRSGIYQEYGLSRFLYFQYGRLLKRSLFNSSGEYGECTVKLAILHYVFGSVSEIAIKCSREASLLDLSIVNHIREKQMDKILRLSNRIEKEQSLRFGEDLKDFEALMRLCVVDRLSAASPSYPEQAIAIAEKHGVRI